MLERIYRHGSTCSEYVLDFLNNNVDKHDIYSGISKQYFDSLVIETHWWILFVWWIADTVQYNKRKRHWLFSTGCETIVYMHVNHATLNGTSTWCACTYNFHENGFMKMKHLTLTTLLGSTSQTENTPKDMNVQKCKSNFKEIEKRVRM